MSEWVFDLDNTLYPRKCGLFLQVQKRMTQFIMREFGLPEREAGEFRAELFAKYGTTLSGLIKKGHVSNPQDYLDYVHDIDYGAIESNPSLGESIARLPGRKLIFTNADQAHAERVLDALGIADAFDASFDIAAAGYDTPKPAEIAYRRFLDGCGVDPRRAAMFEDIAHNLQVPSRMGMTTVLVRPEEESKSQAERDIHIHHETRCLDSFLRAAAGA